MKKTRTPWIAVRLEVTFESQKMVLIHGRRTLERIVVKPVFRLSDGTEFTGHRISKSLRKKIERSSK